MRDAEAVTLLSVVGARPNFMKVAPLAAEIEKHNRRLKGRRAEPAGRSVRHLLVHTGQHYSPRMSEAFFSVLKLPRPDVNLEVGSASHGAQTAEILKRFEEVLIARRPDAVILVGDVNSTMACALAAAKVSYGNETEGSHPLIAHVEAGLRSFERKMPEEINRVVTDSVADLLFATEHSAVQNLLREGIHPDRIFLVGNTMIDTLQAFLPETADCPILHRLKLAGKDQDAVDPCGRVSPYSLLTLHRPSNVDSRDTFREIVEALLVAARDIPMIFAAHPRTLQNIKRFGLEGHFHRVGHGGLSPEKINILEPLDYRDFIAMLRSAKVVLTDSGGVQEEATFLNVPCVTLRDTTERPVTVSEGTNIVAGRTREGIVKAFRRQLSAEYALKPPAYWDGRAASRIVPIILQKLGV